MINHVVIVGRLTKAPDVRVTDTGLTVARLSVAMDRGKDENGQSKGADYITVVVFGRSAVNCEKYLTKGSKIGVEGRIRSGMYDDAATGRKVYTTEVYANILEFMVQPPKEEQAPPELKKQDEFAEFVLDPEIPF